MPKVIERPMVADVIYLMMVLHILQTFKQSYGANPLKKWKYDDLLQDVFRSFATARIT